MEYLVVAVGLGVIYTLGLTAFLQKKDLWWDTEMVFRAYGVGLVACGLWVLTLVLAVVVACVVALVVLGRMLGGWKPWIKAEED